jgi:hypothetical protein
MLAMVQKRMIGLTVGNSKDEHPSFPFTRRIPTSTSLCVSVESHLDGGIETRNSGGCRDVSLVYEMLEKMYELPRIRVFKPGIRNFELSKRSD